MIHQSTSTAQSDSILPVANRGIADSRLDLRYGAFRY